MISSPKTACAGEISSSDIIDLKKQIEKLSNEVKGMLNDIPRIEPKKKPYLTVYELIQNLSELPANAEIRFIVNGTGRAYNLSTDEPNQRFDMDDLETHVGDFSSKNGVGYITVTLGV